MLDVRNKVVRRWMAVVATATLLTVPTGATATPDAPVQEDDAEERERESALVDLGDPLNSDDPNAVAAAIESLNANVSAQLQQVQEAEASIVAASQAQVEADAAVQNTELAIEELTAQSDQVVIEAFINPPAEDAFDVFTSESIADASIKQAILDMEADESADVLTRLGDERAALEVQQSAQEEARAAAVEARHTAEDALVDLEAAVDQQTLFVLEVQDRLADEAAAATDPAEAEAIAGRQAALQAALNEEVAEREAAAAAVAAEQARQEAERRAQEMGTFICPVDGPMNFTDTWGAARSGGRSHQGTDMMADTGTPTVAPATGRVEHRGTSLGGLSWYVYGDDGHTYYGTHLSAYANEGVGRVQAGDLIGYVGDSGNAAGMPHLHFEYHPNGGSAINPYPRLDLACPDH